MSAFSLLIGRDCPADCTCRGMAEAYVPRSSRFMEREERIADRVTSARDQMSDDDYRDAVARALKLVADTDI